MHVANTHGAPLWRQKQALEAGIVVECGGANVLEGTILYEQHQGRTRLTLKNGAVIIYDGKTVWVSPANAVVPEPGARLHVLTWPSFLTGPVRLQDSNAVTTAFEARPLQGQPRDSIDLRFRNLPPQQPNAHYVVYSVPRVLTVHAMASIVACGKTPAEALSQPRCVTFEKFEQIEGVSLPTSWTIWNWDKGAGLQGEPLGHVTISNLKFVIPADDAFDKPSGAQEAPPLSSPTTQSRQ